ncbi:glycosyltransferase [Catellatospora sp. TT07R-123]|uniref:MGDG synthase family glycosyltransferase n=1 Tax=Catellatospora sp. TT07R-123 TaxID=2733863 RepID=UPI001BB3724A|nr:glycosyltransferase [Catellatospora sp. TT07R-123]
MPFDLDGSRILIVSASVGAGHNGAAKQLAARLRERGSHVVISDLLELLPDRGRWTNHLYSTQLRFAPRSWGALLRLLHDPALRHLTVAAMTAATGTALAALSKGHDLVVSTYPLASQVLGRLRVLGSLNAPVVTYLCDPAVHPLWIAPGVDAHLALHPDTAYRAMSHGARQVSVCRPAVDPAFQPADPAGRREVRRRLGLPDAPIALVVGGSWGVGRLAATARDVAATGAAVPVVACGGNHALRRRLRAEGIGIAVGWTDQMPDLMRAADVLIHNAGGLTCHEAVASATPMITYRALPGHGADNAAALRDSGLSPWPQNRDQLRTVLTSALRRDRRPDVGFCAPPPADLLARYATAARPAEPATAGAGR